MPSKKKTWKERYEEHAVPFTLGLMLVSGATGFGMREALVARDLAELDRYRAIGGSPEQIKGRLEPGGNEPCGTHRFRFSKADINKPMSQTVSCGGATFFGEALVGTLPNGTQATQFKITALSHAGAKAECAINVQPGKIQHVAHGCESVLPGIVLTVMKNDQLEVTAALLPPQ